MHQNVGLDIAHRDAHGLFVSDVLPNVRGEQTTDPGGLEEATGQWVQGDAADFVPPRCQPNSQPRPLEPGVSRNQVLHQRAEAMNSLMLWRCSRAWAPYRPG